MVTQIQQYYSVKCLDSNGESKQTNVDSEQLPLVEECTKKYAIDYFKEKNTQRKSLPLFKQPTKELLDKKISVREKQDEYVTRAVCAILSALFAAGFLAVGITLAVLVHPAFAALIAGTVILGIVSIILSCKAENDVRYFLNSGMSEFNKLADKFNEDNSVTLKDAALFFRGDLFKKMLSDLDVKIEVLEKSGAYKDIEQLDELKMIRANFLEVDAFAERLLPRKAAQVSTDAEATLIQDKQATAPLIAQVE